MSEVDRFTRQGVGASDRAGFWVHAGDFNQKMAQAQDRVTYLEGQIEKWTALSGKNFKRAEIMKLERDALQQRLTAADERADSLETALRKIKVRLDAYVEADMRMPEPSVEVCQAIADAALKPAERPSPPTCTWSEGGFSWRTGCGKEWQFTDGGLPSENGMRFCHSCGKTLVVEDEGDE